MLKQSGCILTKVRSGRVESEVVSAVGFFLEAPLVWQGNGELKDNFFQNSCRGGTVEELFPYIFGIYVKSGYDNPLICLIWSTL